MLENGVQWDYGYDAMGQVISGQKKDAAGQPVPGTQFGYAYDGIGNRTSATVNGRTGTYTADAANQYTQRQVPGAVDIRGSASPAAKVTVNGQKVQRWGDYFYKGLAVDNSAAPQFPGVSVLAVRQAAGPNGEDVKSETAGNLFLAKTPELFTHDLEGNLSADGRWNYTWDGENRLIRMETLAAVPAAAKRKLDFAYDAHSRRIRKQVSTWNGSAWVLQSDRRYLYDGWNLVAELDAANAMLRTYTWGLDLSRTPQGAGGVGGLLAIHEGGESYLPAYDGNGNVMALVKASDESIAARYEYGPFGETLVAQESGISNPFRFSTKFQDGESGLYYYGFRYYDAVTGRWPSRDPIEEEGGLNLYGFLGNDGIDSVESFGLCNASDVGKRYNVRITETFIGSELTMNAIKDQARSNNNIDDGQAAHGALGIVTMVSTQVVKSAVGVALVSLQGPPGYSGALKKTGKAARKLAVNIVNERLAWMDQNRRVNAFFTIEYNFCCPGSCWGYNEGSGSVVVRQGEWENSNDPKMVKELAKAAKDALDFVSRRGSILTDKDGKIIRDCQ